MKKTALFVFFIGLFAIMPFLASFALAQAPVLPSIAIWASPYVIDRGSPAVIGWSVIGATSCYGLGGWHGSKPTFGSETVAPLVDTTYVLVCNNGIPGQYSTASVFVRINSYFPQSQYGGGNGNGQVLGVGDIATGPENITPWALAIGFLTALIFHFAFFRRKEAPVNFPVELDAEIKRLRTAEDPSKLSF